MCKMWLTHKGCVAPQEEVKGISASNLNQYSVPALLDTRLDIFEIVELNFRITLKLLFYIINIS